MDDRRAQAAWERIESLGGYGVWEADTVVVSFADAGITDDDLVVFATFPFVQILDLSNNRVTDACLKHLEHLSELETLAVVNTDITRDALERFQRSHPNIEVQTEPMSPDTINPFTGKPLGQDRE